MGRELLAVTTARGVLGHDEDVFCVVKHRMHSLHPNSCPSLALRRQRYLAVPTRAPAEWEAPTPFKGDRVERLLRLATTLEKTTEEWGRIFILPSCSGSAGVGPRPCMSSSGAWVVGHRCHASCSSTALLRQCILWALA